MEATFIWVVTRSDVRWVRSDLGTSALRREVAALRCGLDADAWDGAGAQACAKALEIPLGKAIPGGELLPFDHARAYKLYTGLFGAVQDRVRGKHLLIVPSGALTQLPFQALVTAPPPPRAGRRSWSSVKGRHCGNRFQVPGSGFQQLLGVAPWPLEPEDMVREDLTPAPGSAK